jgi:starch synthase (maltosyl-transferring)
MKFPKPQNILIQDISPLVEGGKYPIKRIPGDSVTIRASIFRHSHEEIQGQVCYRTQGSTKWQKQSLTFLGNDEWEGSFLVSELGLYQYFIQAQTVEPKDKWQKSKVYEVRVDPVYAQYSAWYEIFPRSQGSNPNQSATWDDCTRRLQDIKNMGFDVLYLTPIHPIGQTNKKGKNNSLDAQIDEPGCPYAIGFGEGGHYELEPTLGGWESFRDYMKNAQEMGFTMALDVALNASPDHPHVKEHPEWFFHEADGTIKCAENPPKKYEDVYPYDYFNENWQELWQDIHDMIVHWVKEGFKIFRIDNPHTKPFQFWEWLIPEVKSKHPDVVFLAEAFTRPKLMYKLAALGFDQSYSYFTWREQKGEIEEYLTELTQSAANQCMRANFFPTTPDILPEHLKNAPASMFKMRLMLAASLSSVYGMLAGYELVENEPHPKKEEYWNSEKYQFKVRDWNKTGNIIPFVTKLNAIRKDNPALHQYNNLKFHHSDNDNIIVYSKSYKNNHILFIVNLDGYQSQSGWVQLNSNAFGLANSYEVEDLLDGQMYKWEGNHNFVILDPNKTPGHVFKIISHT